MRFRDDPLFFIARLVGFLAQKDFVGTLILANSLFAIVFLAVFRFFSHMGIGILLLILVPIGFVGCISQMGSSSLDHRFQEWWDKWH